MDVCGTIGFVGRFGIIFLKASALEASLKVDGMEDQ
jgi:hypothetical protein